MLGERDMQMKKLMPESYSDPFIFKVTDSIRDCDKKIEDQKKRKQAIIEFTKELKKAIKFAEKISWFSAKKMKSPQVASAIIVHDKHCQELLKKADELGIHYGSVCWDLMKIV